MAITTLLVEDDENLSCMLIENLEIEGFNVIHLRRGEDVLTAVNQHSVDVILMDVELNGKLNGFEVAENLRLYYPKLPIIFTTGKIHYRDTERGFRLKYVDYQKKPFGSRELIARIINLLDREVKVSPKTYKYKGFSFLPADHMMIIDNKEFRLTKSEASFLAILCENMGSVVSKEAIAERLWGKTEELSKDHSMNNLSHKIRKCLNGNPYLDLKTISKVGYRLMEKG